MLNNECTLLVMSCDRYSSAWYPFFSLLEKYWPQHPHSIILCTERKHYSHDGLNIQMANSAENDSWSDRLNHALSMVSTKYVVFTLEDFFLQAPVDHAKVIECYNYMECHPEVAQCRFKNCDNDEQLQCLGNAVMKDFYDAPSNVIFRLDTQIALWNTEWLHSFVVSGENPWQFETIGTQRIKDTEAKFLWYHAHCNPKETHLLMFPYQMALSSGYGISMGHWLWNNKKLFEKNQLCVNLSELGVLSKIQVEYNLLVNRAVWHKDPRFSHRCFALLYKIINKICHTGSRLRISILGNGKNHE